MQKVKTFTKDDLLIDYFDNWIDLYKRGSVRKVTLEKYLNNAKWLENNGYDDAIIILRKDQEVGIAVSDANSQFAPYMLDGLYNELNERNKMVFAMNLLNIDIDKLIETILEEEQENED